jgi:hypothetical protein
MLCRGLRRSRSARHKHLLLPFLFLLLRFVFLLALMVA